MSVSTIDPKQAQRMIASGQAVLVDVRSPAEHARERIEGARCAPLDQLNHNHFADEQAALVFHCRSGMRTQAHRDTLLAAAGGQPCYMLTGGIEAWKKEGHATQLDRSQPIDIMRQVQIAAGTLVLIGVLGGFFITPALFGLAGFVGAGLTFAGISGFCGMARLLALMPWNRRALTAS